MDSLSNEFSISHHPKEPEGGEFWAYKSFFFVFILSKNVQKTETFLLVFPHEHQKNPDWEKSLTVPKKQEK